MKRARPISLPRLSALALGLFLAPALPAAVPDAFNYQGKLSDAAGAPVTNTAPGVSMSFRIYDGLGTLLTTYVPASPIPVSGGVFQAVVGDLAAGTMSGPGLPAALSGAGDRYLEVVVNGTPLSPRQRLVSAPYAMSVADGSVGPQQLAPGAVTDDRVSGVDWSKLTGLPAGLADGIDNGELTVRSAGAFVVMTSTTDFVPPLTVASAGGVARVGVDASSMTLMGNAFNAPSRLLALDGAGAVPAALGGTGGTSTSTARASLEMAWRGVNVNAGGGLAGGGSLTGDVTVGLDVSGFGGCSTSAVVGKVYWDGTRLACGIDDGGMGGTVTGSGILNRLVRWTSPGGIGSSIVTDNGTSVSVAGDLSAGGAMTATAFSGVGSALTGVDAASLDGQGPAGYASAVHGHDAGDLVSGVLVAARGGTGFGSYTTGNYLNALSATSLRQATPGQMRTDIGAAGSGVNADITSLSGLTAPLGPAQGGTGASSVAGARTALSAAAAGANSDITDLAGLAAPLALTQGGTGAVDAAGARGALGLGALATLNGVGNGNWSGAALGAGQGGTGGTDAATALTGLGGAASGANGDITAFTGLITPLSVGQGGTGMASYTAGNYISALNAATLQQRTPAQVRNDLGAAAAGANADITSLNGLTAPLGLAQGGTGAASASAARTALGLGTLATIGSVGNANWSGGAMTLAHGGTGATTVSTARTALGLGISGTCTSSSAKLLWNGTQLTCGTDAGWTGLLTGGGTGGNLAMWTVGGVSLGSSIMSESGVNVSISGNLDSWITGRNGGTWSGVRIDVPHGGTGATTASGARTNLELGTLATRNTVDNNDWSGRPLSYWAGGTSSHTALGARWNMGIGDLATFSSINDSNWSSYYLDVLSVAHGGTGGYYDWDARAQLGLTKVVVEVFPGTGLLGGGTSGTVSLSIDPAWAPAFHSTNSFNGGMRFTDVNGIWTTGGKFGLGTTNPSAYVDVLTSGDGYGDPLYPITIGFSADVNAGTQPVNTAYGLRGVASGGSTNNYGGWFQAFSNDSSGGWATSIQASDSYATAGFPTYAAWFQGSVDVNGTLDVGGTAKTFVIPHPMDPGRFLVHATQEGPEGAVSYRGVARLANGRGEVALPAYFESLTRLEGRTVLLTNLDGFDALTVRTAPGRPQVDGGRFTVVSDNPASSQEFMWEVQAVRKDVAPLEVEPLKEGVDVAGDGPYTYIKSR